MTKEKIDALFKGLDKLGLGADDKVICQSQSTRNDAVLVSVVLALFV